MEYKISERQKIEKDYHNRRYQGDISSDTYCTGTVNAYKFYWSRIGNVKSLKILDFGCGNGWLSILLAKRGAEVWGIDISEELIKQANQFAVKEGLSEKIFFQEMAAETLGFEDNFFNLIIGSAILHHTELSLAINNLHRVLKPGGRAIFVEPMNQNIFLKIWRKLTPWRRSPVEKALTYKELKLIQNIFPNAKFYFFSFTSIFTQGILLFSPKNKLFLFVNDLLERFDSIFFKTFPFFGKYSAIVVIELVKGNAE